MNEQTVIKLKDIEISEIKDLQHKFQDIRLRLGDLQIEKISLDNAVSTYVSKDKSLKEEWETLQKTEKDIVDKMLASYGEGTLSISDGTFISTTKK